VLVEKNGKISLTYDLCPRPGGRRGFTLLEVLVVVGIVSILTAISLPVLTKVRRCAGQLECMQNQRQIVAAVNLFAGDNEGRYPESVATIGRSQWCWDEPTLLTGYDIRSPGLHRAVSEYLGSYIRDASIMVCPNAPRQYKYLQQAWDAGDGWQHPEYPPRPDPLYGSYCFFWNYVGYLSRSEVFKGPRGAAYNRTRSTLLVSDYFGYDHWKSRGSFGSSEIFKGANVTEESLISLPFWYRPAGGCGGSAGLQVRLHAGYADGHVATFGSGDVVAMLVSTTPDGKSPNMISPGVFFLPEESLP